MKLTEITLKAHAAIYRYHGDGTANQRGITVGSAESEGYHTYTLQLLVLAWAEQAVDKAPRVHVDLLPW